MYRLALFEVEAINSRAKAFSKIKPTNLE